MKIKIRISVMALILALFATTLAGCTNKNDDKIIKSVNGVKEKPALCEFLFHIEFVRSGGEQAYTMIGTVNEDYTNRELALEFNLMNGESQAQKIARYYKPNKYGMRMYQLVDDVNWSMPQYSEKDLSAQMEAMSPSQYSAIIALVSGIEVVNTLESESSPLVQYKGVIEGKDIRVFFESTLVFEFLGIKIIDDTMFYRDIQPLQVTFTVEQSSGRVSKIDIDMSMAVSQFMRRWGMRVLDKTDYENSTIRKAILSMQIDKYGDMIEIDYPEGFERIEEAT